MQRTKRMWSGRVGQMCMVAVLAMVALPGRAADTFVKPTPEELTMTSVPGYPGAAAVVLFDEEITKDDLHEILHYQRVKVLNEEGKRYANVELNYVRTSAYGEYEGNDQSVGEIVGRTIHADGTIIPFTGKPYLKTIEKAGNVKVQSMVFTLPDVDVGSIIEYRYATRYNDHAYEAPDWYIQRELYVKSAHYQWYPTLQQLVDSEDGGKWISKISWFPILPPGAKIVRTETPAPGSSSGTQQVFDLVVHDVPPEPKEDHMPPISAFSYRVLFNFTPYDSNAEFWKVKGKQWSKRMDTFAGPNGDLKTATQAVIAGAATPEEKLHKIYATVMGLENTRYTRERENMGPVNLLAESEAETLSLAAGKLLNHTDKARLELKAHDVTKAKQDIEKAITLANIVKEGVPAFNVKTEISAGDKKYVDESKMIAWLVPIHEELSEVKVLEPIRAAKKDANDAGKPQPEQLEVRSTLALLDDHLALIGLEKAKQALNDNKPENADIALAKLQSDGVVFNYVVAELPLGKIQADLINARASVKDNHMPEAKSALAAASDTLGSYARTASDAKKAAAEKMQEEIKQLSASLNTNISKSQETIDKWWHQVTGWSSPSKS